MNDILKIENLTYTDVLSNISFNLKEKSFNVLIGSNGSGKTTIVKCIIGLLKYNGNITYKNNYIDNKIQKEIGVISDFNILLDGTVMYNLMYPLLNLKFTEEKAKKKVYEICKKLDIENLLLKNINSLLINEKKIVLFAVSIIHDPSLIIIDDTFDELDTYYRNKIIAYLKNIKKATILFITNNIEDLKYSENVIIINKGTIVFNGLPLDLLNNERVLLKANLALPFLASLSTKLQAYGLLDKLILDQDKMVNEIWK